MLTKKVKNRIIFLIIFFTVSLILIFFILKSLNNNILYFKTPSQIKLNTDIVIEKSMRVGGMVKKNSILANESEIKFIITDFKNEIIVSYNGTVPNLFSEGKGVVAEGKLKDRSFFIAERILAKHDENYMPPEIKEILEKNVK